MDVVKTSLIIGIGLTLYYLLLQWPIENKIYDSSSQGQAEIKAFSDSKRSLSEPLAPLSQTSQGPVEIDAQELNYFEIQNDDLSLLVDVARQVEGRTICAFGESFSWPVQSFIHHFLKIVTQ